MKKSAVILIAGLFSIAASAQDPVSEALPFLQLDYNPSSIAMGSTRVPSAALLPFSVEKLEGGVSYQSYMPEFNSTSFIGGGVAGRYEKLGLSVFFVNGTGEKVYVMEDFNPSKGYYQPSEMLLNVGLSYAFLDFLALGVNVKYTKESLWNFNDISGISADVFVGGELNAIDFAAGISSVGPKVKASSSSEEYNLPSALTLGAGYTLDVAEDHSLCVRGKVDSYFGGAIAAGLGAEYCYSESIFVRAGYHYGGDSVLPTFASAGLGLCFKGITVDASYIFSSEVLKGSFAVSAGVRF